MRAIPALVAALLFASALSAACLGQPQTTGVILAGEGEALGLVIGVVGSGPAEVDRFTLRTDAGTELTLEIRPGRLAPGSFPPAHLREHLASGEKVRVSWVDEGASHVATGLFDTP